MRVVAMPKLSDSMTEGTIVRWLKAPGVEVKQGDDLVEIETDKATLTFEAAATGILEILAAEGQTLPIGAEIAEIRENAGAPVPQEGTTVVESSGVQATNAGEPTLGVQPAHASATLSDGG